MGRHKEYRPFVVRPWSLGKCPTPDEVLSAWQNRRASQKDFINLLSVLNELTCFTDCHLQHCGGFGNIAGRAGGLKAYLAANIPSLVPRYKSISRYATLASRLRKAFNFYPPAVLAQLHPELPHPRAVNMPFIANFARKLYRAHFKNLPPTYSAFKEVVDRQLASDADHPFAWGPVLPREAWPEAERSWRAVIVRQAALQYYAKSVTVSQ